LNIERRQLAVTAWMYPLAGLALSTVLIVSNAGLRSLVSAAAMLAVVPAAYIAARQYSFPRVFTLGVAAVGVLYDVVRLTDEYVTTGDELALADVIDLLATGIIIALAAFLVSRQRGGLRPGDIVDSVIIGTGGWLVAWVVFVQPFVNQTDQDTVGLVLNSLYLPTTLLVLTLTAILLFGGGRPRSATVLISLGLTSNVIGDVMYALGDMRNLGSWAYTSADALYVMSVTACGGAFIHPSAPALIGKAPIRRDVPLPGRLTLLLASLIAPVMLIALVQSSSLTDRLVRAGSALVLLTLVAIRFFAATRSQIATQSKLQASVRTDELTLLPNKRALFELVDESISECWRSDARPSLYLFDLDGFKNVNDSYGHAVGDQVLEVIAGRLIAASQAVGATATRVSGDEFVVFDATPTSSERAVENARAILLAFQQPLSTVVGDVFIKSSCGIACMPVGSPTSSEDLFRWADIAMYRAKAAGRNRAVLYESSMQERVSSRMDIESALHGVLVRRELLLFHQPIIDIMTGRVCGVEALMRWQRPDGTMVPPNEFIPIAEESGIIESLGSWALLEALEQLRSWIDERIVPADTTMSVNVSPHQLADPRFPGTVHEALRRSGLPAHLLWLEVTESVMVENPILASAVLHQIREMGVRIALDDFGTGYSSLSLLQQFPIQRIKIDRAFISSIDVSENDRSLVRTIIGLGELMSLDIVAEGVETMAQLKVLRSLGCAKAQGYLISRPAPPEAMRSTVASLASLSRQPDFARLMGDTLIEHLPVSGD
jgi:diguanylate cyclase